MNAPIAGVCRFCGCIESNACRLADGDTCGWMDASRTVCNAPGCLRAWSALGRKKRQPRKRTPGDVHALIAGRGRAPRKPKAGAA